MSTFGPGKQDDVSEAFGMDRHSERDNHDGGTHHTVSNDVTRFSWDEDRNGNYVDRDSQGRDSYHETLAPDTSKDDE